jgi:hypothetical protein
MDDLKIAKKYLQKEINAKKAGHDFKLSFAEFKRLMNRRLCSYSGLELIEENEKFCSRTIDRIDQTKGYINGNVEIVAYGINALKATIENPIHEMTLEAFIKTARALNKQQKVKPKK